MNDFDNKQIRQLTAYASSTLWWYLLLRGLLLLGVGIFLLIRPGLGTAMFVQVIGAFLLIDGILSIVAAIKGGGQSLGTAIIRGAIQLLLGLFIFLQPALIAGIATKTVIIVVGVLIIIHGILGIVGAARDTSKNNSIMGGIVWLAFGVFLLWNPMSVGLLFVQLVGVFAVVTGVSLLIFGTKFRKLSKAVTP